MRLLLIALLCAFSCTAQARPARGAANPEYVQSGLAIIGRGSTTFAYIDPLNLPCGVGLKSSGNYPVVTGTLPTEGEAPFWAMGDSPCPDLTDPTLSTTAQWETKYGWVSSSSTYPTCSTTGTANNAAMVTFLNTRKGFTNTANIYYLAQSGNDSTGLVNCPDLPYATTQGIIGTPSVAGPLQATTQTFTGTATMTSGSKVITLASGTGLTKTMYIAGSHIPAGTFIWGQLNSTQYVMTNAASATVTSAEAVTGGHLNGGAIIIRAGSWTTSAIKLSPTTPNASWELSGSYGYPVLIMAFPGEVVFDGYEDPGGYAISMLGTYTPQWAACCVIVDGIQFSAPTFYTGYGIKIAHFEDLTVRNSEFAGYDDAIETAPEVKKLSVESDVFHEIAAHGVYIAFGTDYYPSPVPNYSEYCDVPAAQDFNFAADEANYLNGASCGAMYQLREVGNLMYDGGDQGLDPVHVNAYVDQVLLSGNIVMYVGASGLDLQSGDYNATAIGNIVALLGAECFEQFLSGNNAFNGSVGAGNGVATHRWNSFVNNICYLASPSNSIWGEQPGSAVFEKSGIAYVTGTLSGTTLTAVSGYGVGIAPNALVTGTGVPGGTTILPYGTNSTTGSGSFGSTTYALSQNVTTEGSESIEIKNPVGNTVSDTLYKGNIMVVTDNGGSMGQDGCCTNSIPFDFEYNTLPETNSITGNTFWSGGNTSNRMMVVSTDASTAGTIGSGNYIAFSGGTGCIASTGSFSNCFPGNTYAGSNPFVNMGSGAAMSALYQTPGAYDFAPYNLR